MAYKTKELYEKAKKAIEDNNLFFIEDIVTFLPCTKPTFYDHFPVDSNDFNALKELLEDNKVNTKVKLRRRLAEGDKAAEILALYKLIGTDKERKALSQNYTDITTGGDKVNIPPIDWVGGE